MDAEVAREIVVQLEIIARSLMSIGVSLAICAGAVLISAIKGWGPRRD